MPMKSASRAKTLPGQRTSKNFQTFVTLTPDDTLLAMCRRATGVLLLVLATRALLAQDLTLNVVLTRLHQYLRDYAELLPATIAIERYNQRVGARERVELESEFGIVRVPNNPQWLGFRDVMRVNGKAVESRGAGDNRRDQWRQM